MDENYAFFPLINYCKVNLGLSHYINNPWFNLDYIYGKSKNSSSILLWIDLQMTKSNVAKVHIVGSRMSAEVQDDPARGQGEVEQPNDLHSTYSRPIWDGLRFVWSTRDWVDNDKTYT